MPLHFRENRYAGVNAHLQSHLQSPGGDWASFHGIYIAYLYDLINSQLPDGYYALNEKSLQLIEVDGSAKPQRTDADIGIFQEYSASGGAVAGAAVEAAELIIPTLFTLSDEDQLQAVIIYQIQDDKRSQPVTRIELLSPANKPPGSHAQQYAQKRSDTLRSGINMVEIDFLHERCSPILGIPCYAKRQPKSAPFMIIVDDVRASIEKGITFVHRIGIGQPIPTLVVPLAGVDMIKVDFGSVYHRTFQSSRYYGMILVDYADLPPRFDTYTPDDQARIRDVMSHIAQSVTD
jgi:hypothetical protein